MNFALSEVAAALALPAGAELSLSGVAVDSRAVRPGNLFVALPGARVDGHDFAAEALSRGAAAVLAERQPPDVPDVAPVLIVPDSREGLLRLAGALKRNWGFRLAAITGSAGKTTTK